MIKIESLNKYYNKGSQNEIHVIDNVSLELPESGIVAIYGKSGCGKTTLLNAIGGLDSYDSGSICIGGEKLDKNIDLLRNKYIGYIFQNYYLNKKETVYENVANAIKLCGITDINIIDQRVISALKNVGMDKYKNRYPDTLSGGQQQRVAIARAIVKNPRIILADEPTGNLDEKNTVMIMDLLKEIGKSHLVLLVTHEENIVQYYCNQIINVSDGKIVEVVENIVGKDVSIKNKSDIYLGELEKSTFANEKVKIDYYGEKPDEPIKLKIVNDNGNFLIRIDTPKIKTIDGKSEIKLKEGVFKETKLENHSESHIDMTNLPPIDGESYGKLYTLKDAIKYGFRNNFVRKKRRSERNLHVCLILFAIVIVVFFASFGTSFKNIEDARDSYNQNVFYVYNDNKETNKKLNDSLNDPNSGIDYIQMNYNSKKVYESHFEIGSFETASLTSNNTNLFTNTIYLSNRLLDDLELLEGRKTNLSKNEIVISSKVAEILIDKSYISSINNYSNMIGLMCSTLRIGDNDTTVVGVVESSEPVIYVDEFALTEMIIKDSGMNIYLASDYEKDLKEGEAIFISYRANKEDDPKKGSKVLVNGIEVEVKDIIYANINYENWLQANYKEKYDYAQGFYEMKLAEEYSSEEILNKKEELLKKIHNKYYFDYMDLYYECYYEYLKNEYIYTNSFNLWCIFKKGLKEFVYQYMPNKEAYYYAKEYKSEFGEYPTFEEATNNHKNKLESLFSINEKLYFSEYEKTNNGGIRSDSYLISDEDYIKLLTMYGEIDKTVLSYTPDDPYMLVHSKDVKLTEKWLENEFGDKMLEDIDVIVTPSDMYDYFIENYIMKINSNIITLVVLIGIMCVCMYFIMKSSLMSRIKEIGIYRAIGVTKKNFLFMLLIENIVLALGTVVLGHFLISGFLYITRSISPSLDVILYYPWYSFVLSLIILVVASIMSGLIPSFILLQKTPSQILSKYDI